MGVRFADWSGSRALFVLGGEDPEMRAIRRALLIHSIAVTFFIGSDRPVAKGAKAQMAVSA